MENFIPLNYVGNQSSKVQTLTSITIGDLLFFMFFSYVNVNYNSGVSIHHPALILIEFKPIKNNNVSSLKYLTGETLFHRGSISQMANINKGVHVA